MDLKKNFKRAAILGQAEEVTTFQNEVTSDNVNDRLDDSNKTALMYAAQEGNAPLLEFLLSINDVDVNLLDNEGNNALMLAVKYKHPEIVKLLVAITELQHVNGAGDTVFHMSDDIHVNDELKPYVSRLQF